MTQVSWSSITFYFESSVFKVSSQFRSSHSGLLPPRQSGKSSQYLQFWRRQSKPHKGGQISRPPNLNCPEEALGSHSVSCSPWTHMGGSITEQRPQENMGRCVSSIQDLLASFLAIKYLCRAIIHVHPCVFISEEAWRVRNTRLRVFFWQEEGERASL